PLSSDDNRLLLEALFGVANCRFDLAAYDEAIRLYNDLKSRYQHQVEGLVALRQLCRCYLLLEKPRLDNAEATLKAAGELLTSLDDTALRGGPELQTREGWEKWLRERRDEIARAKLQIDTSGSAPPSGP